MSQGRWFHGQSLNLAWVSVPSTHRPSESSALAIKAAVTDETISRVDANGGTEELSLEEQHHVDKDANITDDALQGPARVL